MEIPFIQASKSRACYHAVRNATAIAVFHLTDKNPSHFAFPYAATTFVQNPTLTQNKIVLFRRNTTRTLA
jgi:hypothetical protein